MLIHKQAPIERLASDDPGRGALTAVALELESEPPLAVASNGYAMAVVPVTAEPGDTSGMLQAAALADARKATKRDAPVSVRANGHVEYTSKAGPVSTPRAYAERGLREFPKWREIQPKADRRVVRVALDAPMLAELALAIGAVNGRGHGHVVLEIPLTAGASEATLDAIRVVPTEPQVPGAYGLIMPVVLP